MLDPFVEEIRQAIRRGAPLSELVDILRRYRDGGLMRDEAYASLKELRPQLEGDDEDRLLEVLDVVCNWCPLQQRVWSEDPSKKRA